MRIALPLLLGTFLLAACQPQEEPFPVRLSLKEVMAGVVDPAADGIWDAVSTSITAKGEEHAAPQSEAEWLALRAHAVRLVEAGNLLQVHGRAVAPAGSKLDDEGTPGILGPDEIRRLIEADRPAFDAAARALQQPALAVLAAIDSRSAEAVLAAGGAIEQACEGCHARFWYPGAKGPNVAALKPQHTAAR